MKIKTSFANLLKSPFNVVTEEHPRNEHGCGYTWYKFYVNNTHVYTHRQYHDFGYPNKVVEFDVTDEIALFLHNSGVWEMNEYVHRALTK